MAPITGRRKARHFSLGGNRGVQDLGWVDWRRCCVDPRITAIGIDEGEAGIDEDSRATFKGGIDEVFRTSSSNAVVLDPGRTTPHFGAGRNPRGEVEDGGRASDRSGQRIRVEQITAQGLGAESADARVVRFAAGEGANRVSGSK